MCFHFKLEQIGGILPTADELTKLELYDLEKDLKELISVTQGKVLLDYYQFIITFYPYKIMYPCIPFNLVADALVTFT